MPIINGSIEYTIPSYIRAMITPEFCAQFLKELHVIFGVSIEDTDMDCFAYQGGTSGWVVAFASSCRKLGLDELYKYYTKLEWYDSDIFDGEMEDILVEYKLILGGFLSDEIARQNDISLDSVRCCDKCGKYYHINDIVNNEIDLEIEGDDEPYVEVICKSCASEDDVQTLHFDINRSITEILNKIPTDFFVCEKCGKTHYISHRGEKHCLHCEQNVQPDKAANDYYLEELEAERKYRDRIFLSNNN